jgi:hypothetical protein
MWFSTSLTRSPASGRLADGQAAIAGATVWLNKVPASENPLRHHDRAQHENARLEARRNVSPGPIRESLEMPELRTTPDQNFLQRFRFARGATAAEESRFEDPRRS